MDKKYIDSIKMPSNIDSVIDNAISRAERNKNKKKNKMKIAAAAIFISSLAIFSLTNKTFADNVPFLGKVFEKVKLKEPELDNNYNKYAQGVNSTQTNGGISIKIDQTVCDGNNIILSVIVSSKDGFKEYKKPFGPPQIHLDGLVRADFEDHYEDRFSEALQHKFNYEEEGYKELITSQGFIGEMVDKNTFIGIGKYDLTQLNKDIPNKFKVKFNINNLNYDFSEKYNNPVDIKGHWNFEFEVEKIGSSQIKTIKPSLIKNDIEISKITVTPYSTSIIYYIPKNLKYKHRFFDVLDSDNNKINAFYGRTIEDKSSGKLLCTETHDKLPVNSKFIKIKLKPDEEPISIPLN